MYTPTWVDWGLFLGTICFFGLLFLLFLRFVPAVPVSEVKELRTTSSSTTARASIPRRSDGQR